MFPTFENGCQPGLPLNSMIGPGTVPTGFPGQASLHLPIGRHPLQLLLPCQGNHFLGELAIVDRNLNFRSSEAKLYSTTGPWTQGRGLGVPGRGLPQRRVAPEPREGVGGGRLKLEGLRGPVVLYAFAI